MGHFRRELALFFALLLNTMKLPVLAYKVGLAGHVPVTPNRIINVYQAYWEREQDLIISHRTR
jgi:hypothetical protein